MPRLHLDWDKFADVVRDGGSSLFPSTEINSVVVNHNPTQGSSTEEKWIGLSPHVSVVARDWRSTQLLVGQASLTDLIRLMRSTRMVVTRVRFADGRLMPFAQVGFGQWRVDTDLMPSLPINTEVATQFGSGFELRLAPRCLLAVEVDYTVLYRDEHESQSASGPRLWGSSLAARALF
jgi:hypothetical protein